ncbi:DNRLRE domain-containing protein [Shewanella surugensis]|uniref:DNRLRE domain-containing protein n=1 Tax=Shewanella surugensis TaxID=212020 RepID=A0ABT0LEW2_9GAMM|nr:DNRLRE domain-containing protein [Shewanella surugensis]MCL1126242.1 DNRLRE domain-containing protein [Shewanella surugensis]
MRKAYYFYQMLIGVFCLLPLLATAASVTRGPYLQMANHESVTVRWRTDVSTSSVVRYGITVDQLDQSVVMSGSRTEHEVRVTGLNASRQFYYSIGTETETLEGGELEYRFMTSPPVGSDAATRVWLIGDAGTANTNAQAVYNAYLNHEGSDATSLWIMLGDNAYNSGTDNEYQNAVFDMYPELLRRSTLWATLGNHDGYSADSDTESGPYYDIFSLPRQGEAGGLASGTEAYYSFDYGNIHFISLDSYETDRSVNGAMMTWLADDLAANTQIWTIAFWHHPPYSKGSHDSDNESQLIDMRENALPTLESYGVDLVFSGHSHSYERSYLIDGHYGDSSSFNASHQINAGSGHSDGDGAYEKIDGGVNMGAVYTVAGSSGKISGGDLDHPAMFTSLNQLGSVVLDINGYEITAKYLNSNGNVTDYYTLRKGADVMAPTVTNVEGMGANTVSVTFSESVTEQSAENISHFVIDNGVTVTDAQRQASLNSVLLSTSDLEYDTVYQVTMNNIVDLSGNEIAANTQQAFTRERLQQVSFQQGLDGYAGGQDAYIGSGIADDNTGVAQMLLADGSDGFNGELISLLSWDLSSLPNNAVVTEVQLQLSLFNASSGHYDLWQMKSDWQQASVTWNNVDPSSSMGVNIASFSDVPVGGLTLDFNQAGIDLVQSWLDGTQINQGVMLKSSGSIDGVDLRSSEYATMSSRPKLVISYIENETDNEAPNADFSYQVNQLAVNFTDSSSDIDGSIVAWLWDFGDGQTAHIPSPTHHYGGYQAYTVKLTVFDDSGAAHARSQMVMVSDSGNMLAELQNGLASYVGNQDTYVASGNPNDFWGNDDEILADGNDGSNDELVTLLQWDVSSIPDTAIVTGVFVELDVFNRSSGEYRLSAMEQVWSENTATWNNTAPTSHRGVLLGSFTPSSTDVYDIELNAAAITLVQGWIQGSLLNHGMMIESAGSSNGIDMRSSEYATWTQRPKLKIEYHD